MSHLSKKFASPIFRGGRFASHALPIDVLPDLMAYRDLVADLAKHLFLRKNPDRKRVPRGFLGSFQLAIRDIKPDHSAMPELERIGAAQAPVDIPDDFDDARDLIVAYVEAITSGAPPPAEFPAELTKRFEQFGRGLREGESIELLSPGKTSGPRYDKAIRKTILLQHESRYEDYVELTGVLSGGVIHREQLTIQMDNGALIDARCDQEMTKQIVPSFIGRRVLLVGLGSFDRNGLERILRIDDLMPWDEDELNEDELDELDAPTPLEAQFADLEKLQPGWFEENTPALDRAGLERFRKLLERALLFEGIPRPYLYPTPDGEVRAEWSFPGWEVSATADLVTRTLYLHATHLQSDQFEEAELGLDEESAVGETAGFIRRYVPAT